MRCQKHIQVESIYDYRWAGSAGKPRVSTIMDEKKIDGGILGIDLLCLEEGWLRTVDLFWRD